MPQRSDKVRSTATWAGLLALVGLAALAGPAAGQTDSSTSYLKERTFEIPFEMDPGRRVKQVILHVSTDQGRRYSPVVTALPRDNRFVYTAAADGWHLFVVQVEEQDGRKVPADLTAVRAGLRVCVDTTRPEATLRAVQPVDGTVAVEWAARDDYLDLRTLTLEYRPAGGERWTALAIRQITPARFDWEPAGPGPFEVRLSVRDLAGNVATATTKVMPSRRQAAGGATASGGAAGRGRVIFVRSKTFKLNYKLDNVGPSNVKHVEVWMTRDTGMWTRFRPTAPAAGPVDLTVTQQGRYGFFIRPFSGVNRAPPEPSPRQPPHVWVHVDETPPRVLLHKPEVTDTGPDRDTILINWRADDDHLKPQPITILIAENAEGPWRDLRKDVENTGTIRLPTKDLPFQFFVRVEAVDEAGNKGSDTTREPVKVDLKTPTVRDVDVVVPGATPPPADAPPGG